MKKTELGARGEALAADYLEKNGYRILDRNYRCRMGEIDLVARKENTLAFVEVKLRKNTSYGEAREFVTASKQHKLIMAARHYLMTHPWAEEMTLRFDVVEIYAPQGTEKKTEIRHLIDAFEC